MSRNFLQEFLEAVAERGRGLIGLERPASPVRSGDLLALSNALLTGRGEVSGVALAQQWLDAYAAADEEQRRRHLAALADGFGPDQPRLDAAIEAYLQDKSPRAMAELSVAAEPRRQELFRRLNRPAGGTAALVRLREDVLAGLPGNETLEALDADLAHLFSSWFNRGFLMLKRIDWTTPANILAKIIQYEAVHTIHSWDDLRSRLEPSDRRCFAFFHPQMADEPLVFVEVALTQDIPATIAPLLALERKPIRAEDATTAVFYSISNCQTGLRRVSFGNLLIKQVVEELRRDLPKLKSFVTLSPVPGFMGWLKRELAKDEPHIPGVADLTVLEGLFRPAEQGGTGPTEAMREAQLAAAAHYFLAARTSSGAPIDPVARFHLGNGARLERINWRGDVSPNGLRQAGGLMVNYLYDLDAIEDNHEAFANQGVIAASPAVRKLLKASETKPVRRKTAVPALPPPSRSADPAPRPRPNP
ncbi:MCD, Malonyl-CoA decarboxylase MCD [Labrys sp. KNU-23]|uniref:malonyl-CoA decarboxylase n=1 Tax=Labrys sp. KNU-23 TaxID=2789216 RepID=UPI0011ECC9F6|nr:malonyl-CoA decarboxylase [Labrys sp. KNU-23]QEN87051.1 MCD, Malonyl-CoA decarboxylase MCD [Labrys sp. KNU-23]